MSIIKVAIHAVWGTKSRVPFLIDEIRIKVCKHIFEYAKANEIYIDTIDGYTDHLHCLFYLNSNIALNKTMQVLKGESSNWINKNQLTKKKFGWADDYYAASVCESNLEKVRTYIKNQKIHHQMKSLQEELDDFRKSVMGKAD